MRHMDRNDWVDLVTTILLVLFGLFMAYQLLRYLLGGSREIEGVVIGFLVLSIGMNIAVYRKSDHNSYQSGSHCLVSYPVIKIFGEYIKPAVCQVLYNMPGVYAAFPPGIYRNVHCV